MLQEYDLAEDIVLESTPSKELENEKNNSHTLKYIADIPVGIVDLPSKYLDHNDSIKRCVKKLKTLQLDDLLIITTESDAIGTGKSTFFSVLLRKQEIRSHFSGGIFYLNPGEINSEIEYLSLLRQLLDDLINFCAKGSLITTLQSHQWLHTIRPSYGNVLLEDCLKSLREITTVINSLPNSRRVLVVMNDLRTDYLPRLLRGYGMTFLMSTRYLDLFTPEQFQGISFFPLEFCPRDQRSRIFDSAPTSSSLFSSSSNLTNSLLTDLFDTCTSWGELNLLARYLQTQSLDVTFLTQLIHQRKQDLLPGCPSTRWVTDHMNDSWVSISLNQHLGSLNTYLLSYETLSQASKQRYLSLALLPSGVVFPLQFMMTIWGIKLQHECLELLDLFTKRGLVTTVAMTGMMSGHEGEITHRLYSLNQLQTHLLILLLLREQTTESVDCSLLSSFFMCTIFTSTSQASPHRQLSVSIQSTLNEVMTVLVRYLTNKKKFSALPTYRLSKYLVYWRRLHLCSYVGLLPPYHGVIHSFQDTLHQQQVPQTTHEIPVSLVDYLHAATFIIEHLDLEPEQKLKHWLQKGIEILTAFETSSHHQLASTNHSASTTSKLNYFKIADLRNKLGVISRLDGHHKDALDYHISALNTFQSSRRPGGSFYHNEIAQTFLLISEVYRSEGAYNDATKVIQSVIQFQQGITGGSLSLAEIWISLGELHAHQQKYRNAIPCYQKALGIYQSCVGGNHPHAVHAEGLMGIVFLKWGRDLTGTSSASIGEESDNTTTTPEITFSPLTEHSEPRRFRNSSPCDVSLASAELCSLEDCQRRREKGIELVTNAIAWFLRRGYSLTSANLKKLISALPSEERLTIQRASLMATGLTPSTETSLLVTSSLATSSHKSPLGICD
jgi:tetratricopeptide (TPR) repeat protein